MFWDKVYTLEEISFLPSGKFLYSLFFPEDLFFALVDAKNVRTYWLGILNSSFLGRKFNSKLTVKLYLQHYMGFTIKVVTRALYFGVTDSLRREITTVITNNPCLRYLLSEGIKLNIATKAISTFDEGKSLIKNFLSKIDNFCFPASCGCLLCEELGGVAVPTFVGSTEVC